METDTLNARQLSRPGKAVAGEVAVKDDTASTNDDAREQGAAGAAHGTVVLAESQSKGRGRLGRVWQSPPGVNLYFSVVLRSGFTPDNMGIVTIAAGVAVAKAIKNFTGLDAKIKWPNDVRVGGKKLCGILCEAHGEGSIDFVVLGIGINVNLDSRDMPEQIRDIATSVMAETGEKTSRAGLFGAVMDELEEVLSKIEAGLMAEVIEHWGRLSEALGRSVKVEGPEGDFTGLAMGIRGDCALLVETGSGEVRAVTAGDVTIL